MQRIGDQQRISLRLVPHLPEGPKDDKCSQQPFKDLRLAADMPAADTCAKFTPPYPQCGAPIAPVYYREANGVVQVTSICGPIPPSPAVSPVDVVPSASALPSPPLPHPASRRHPETTRSAREEEAIRAGFDDAGHGVKARSGPRDRRFAVA
jgi:hypothetical protein